MTESGMSCTWIYEVGEGQLLQPSEPLKNRSIHDIPLIGLSVNEAMYRVTDFQA